MTRSEESRGVPTALARAGALAARRPRAVLAVWLLAVAVLAVQGVGLNDRLATSNLAVEGTESKEAENLKRSAFGDEDVIVVMLRGPAAEIDRQGPRVSAALDAVPRTRVVSPWAGGDALDGLRPSPEVAGIAVNVGRKPGEGLPDVVPPIERRLDATVRPPVTADVTGQPQVGVAGRDAAFDSAHEAEKIAVPVLLVVLLLVFGSPVAAAIPGLIGGATVAAGYGALSLVSEVVELDALATSLMAMMGLALGVDYSLLIVSRYREEVRRGAAPREAVAGAVATSGRAVVFAGAALTLAMLLAAQIAPGRIATSAATAVIVASLFSVLAGVFAVPALLALAGRHLERWALYRERPEGGGRFSRLSAVLTRRPLVAAAAILVLGLVGSIHALSLHTGPVSTRLLPEDIDGRMQYEAVERGLGPGWGAPLEVMVDGRGRPVTDAGRLAALAELEQRLERDPGVATVAGLEPLARTAARRREDQNAARAPPGTRSSGYLVLAALDGADPGTRSRTGLVLNAERGGQAARIVVIAKTGPQDPATPRTRDRIRGIVDGYARQTDTRIVVGGPGSLVNDYNDVARERLPLVTIALALMTIPVLLLVLRSVLLPLVAAALNVLTVGAAFGILALLFNDSLLGGPGYFDAGGAVNIVTLVYGLSIDYEVFVLARMREEYIRTGDHERAIADGLAHTARVVTGAALIMIAVFLAFGTSDFMSIRNFGVGLAVAVFLDAFVIRLVALPAVMKLLGSRAWWVPGWLDRILPRVDVEAPRRPRAEEPELRPTPPVYA